MRVLFISDVYFPRVNGVSTSIRTFRQDLANCGVDTVLVAPRYDAASAPPPTKHDAASAGEEAGVLRVPGARVPRDPEDRRMAWRALTRTLDALPHGGVDLVHIHTPFVAHYARAAARCGRSSPPPSRCAPCCAPMESPPRCTWCRPGSRPIVFAAATARRFGRAPASPRSGRF